MRPSRRRRRALPREPDGASTAAAAPPTSGRADGAGAHPRRTARRRPETRRPASGLGDRRRGRPRETRPGRDPHGARVSGRRGARASVRAGDTPRSTVRDQPRPSPAPPARHPCYASLAQLQEHFEKVFEYVHEAVGTYPLERECRNVLATPTAFASVRWPPCSDWPPHRLPWVTTTSRLRPLRPSSHRQRRRSPERRKCR